MWRIAFASMEESVNTQTTQNILKFIKYQYLNFLSLPPIFSANFKRSRGSILPLVLSLQREQNTLEKKFFLQSAYIWDTKVYVFVRGRK